MTEKACASCGEVKTIDFFYKKKSSKDGVMHECIECHKKRRKIYQAKNQDTILEQARKNYAKHRDKRLAYDRARKERKKELWQEWKKNNPEKYKENRKKQNAKEDNILKSNLSRRIRHGLIGSVKSKKTEWYIGIDIAGLKKHIESLMEDWMSWKNYNHSNWHIDHIIPCNLYDLEIDEECKKCFNYRNMRPLASYENFSRSNDLDMKLVNQYNISDLLPGTKKIEP